MRLIARLPFCLAISMLLSLNGCGAPADLAGTIDNLVNEDNTPDPVSLQWTHTELDLDPYYSIYNAAAKPDTAPILIVDAGVLHLSYLSEEQGEPDLAYATTDYGRSIEEALTVTRADGADGSGDVTAFDMALDDSGEAHLSYVIDGGGTESIYYVRSSVDGSSTQFTHTAEPDCPVVSGGNYTGTEVIYDSGSEYSRFCVAWLNSSGSVDITSTFNPLSWSEEEPTTVCESTWTVNGFTMVKSSQESVHMAFDVANTPSSTSPSSELYHTARLAGDWSFQLREGLTMTDSVNFSPGHVKTPAIVIDSEDTAHISLYGEFGEKGVRYARIEKDWSVADWTGTNPATDQAGEIIDQDVSEEPANGDWSKIALGSKSLFYNGDYYHDLYILYRGSDDELKLAEFIPDPSDGGAWTVTTIDTPGSVGAGMDIGIDTSRRPNRIHIIYEDALSGKLYHARRNIP